MDDRPIDPDVHAATVADVTERLMAEFDAVTSPADVSRVVLQCFRDLAGVPVGALPELAERLARQLLQEPDAGGG